MLNEIFEDEVSFSTAAKKMGALPTINLTLQNLNLHTTSTQYPLPQILRNQRNIVNSKVISNGKEAFNRLLIDVLAIGAIQNVAGVNLEVEKPCSLDLVDGVFLNGSFDYAFVRNGTILGIIEAKRANWPSKSSINQLYLQLLSQMSLLFMNIS